MELKEKLFDCAKQPAKAPAKESPAPVGSTTLSILNDGQKNSELSENTVAPRRTLSENKKLKYLSKEKRYHVYFVTVNRLN